MKLSVVIPVYGCPAALPELHRRLTDTVSKITKDYEIIFVNDACPKNSWDVVKQICEQDPKVAGIEFSRNFGQMRATLAGLDYCDGDWVVVMDCDLQERPEEILNLYEKAKEGYDVVFARRRHRTQTLMQRFLSAMFYKIYSFAIGTDYDGDLGNLCFIRKDVVKNYCRMREIHREFIAYIQWLGYKQTYVDVEQDERFEGKSSYNFKKRLNLAIDMLTSQSDKALKITEAFGFALTILSGLYIIYIIFKYFTDYVPLGWSSLAAIVLFLGGITISTIGLVGIYVGNIFMQVKNRPLYIVRQVANPRDDGAKAAVGITTEVVELKRSPEEKKNEETD